MKKWCSTYWLYVTYALGIGVFVALLMNWDTWGLAQKLLAVMGFLLPAHVAEEWQVPGGFHYAYNCLFRSDTPNSYPMNQLADMVTNLSGEIFFVILLFIGANKGMLLAMAALGYIEFFGHTVLLVVMHRRFKPVGKQVRYAPGLVTAYLGFLPIAVYDTWYLVQNGIGSTDIWTGVIVFAIMIGGMIILPEAVFTKKDTPYPFPDARYFEKFI